MSLFFLLLFFPFFFTIEIYQQWNKMSLKGRIICCTWAMILLPVTLAGGLMVAYVDFRESIRS